MSREGVKEDNSIDDVFSDNTIDLQVYLDTIQHHKDTYGYFLNWLGDFSNTKVYTVSGNAGTGKTTFINHLKHNNDSAEWIVLDVFRSVECITWFGDVKTKILDFKSAFGKVYEIILEAISSRLFEPVERTSDWSIEEIHSHLEELVSNFNNLFSTRFPPGHQFFEDLKAILNTNDDVCDHIIAIAEYCNRYFSRSPEELDHALDILLLVSRCMRGGYNKKYIIVFDNFERFINHDEIYNMEVNGIRLKVSSYLSEINRITSVHKEVFKFILVIRSSTARMCGVRLQASDSLANNLNIGKWYNSDRIISEKIKWYHENNIIIHDSELVEQIVGDYRKFSGGRITGLKIYIDPMFNDNKRLIIF